MKKLLASAIVSILSAVALFEYKRHRKTPRLFLRFDANDLSIRVSNDVGREPAFVKEVGLMLSRYASQRKVLVWSEREAVELRAGDSREFVRSFDALLVVKP